MRKIYFKKRGESEAWFLDQNDILFTPEFYSKSIQLVEEHEIIEKIKKNENGYFDFSKNIIDIGAYAGSYAMLLDFKHNYCFEPNKNSAAIIWANAYIYEKAKSTDVFTVALSDKEETTSFNGFECEINPNKSLLGYNNEYVSCKTLDSFNLKNIGFIKIDVEGFEEKVIRGGLFTIIASNYPPILFECWDIGFAGMTQEKHDNLFSLLNSLGYEIFEHWGDFETHLAIHKTHL